MAVRLALPNGSLGQRARTRLVPKARLLAGHPASRPFSGWATK